MNIIVIDVKGTDIIKMSDTSKVHIGVSVRFLDMHKILFHNFLFLKESCRFCRQFFFYVMFIPLIQNFLQQNTDKS